jgi:hypothetical protein
MSLAHAVRIGYAITAQPLFQIFGFPDVDDVFTSIPHQINARPFRNALEKFLAQPFYQRLWIRK